MFRCPLWLMAAMGYGGFRQVREWAQGAPQLTLMRRPNPLAYRFELHRGHRLYIAALMHILLQEQRLAAHTVGAAVPGDIWRGPSTWTLLQEPHRGIGETEDDMVPTQKPDGFTIVHLGNEPDETDEGETEEETEGDTEGDED